MDSPGAVQVYKSLGQWRCTLWSVKNIRNIRLDSYSIFDVRSVCKITCRISNTVSCLPRSLYTHVLSSPTEVAVGHANTATLEFGAIFEANEWTSYNACRQYRLPNLFSKRTYTDPLFVWRWSYRSAERTADPFGFAGPRGTRFRGQLISSGIFYTQYT